MKKFTTVFVIILAIVALFFYFADKNRMQTVQKSNLPVDIKAHHTQDAFCKMTIQDQKYASEVISNDGIVWFFDDIGCMIKWLHDKRFDKAPSLWIYALDTKEWIDATKAWYSQNEKTPMGYGFGAYAKKGANLISFEEVRKKVLTK